MIATVERNCTDCTLCCEIKTAYEEGLGLFKGRGH